MIKLFHIKPLVAAATYTSAYPPAHNDTYVKATSKATTNYWPYYATDPSKSLTGGRNLNQWISGSAAITNQRFHIDLGSAKTVKRIYYENSHDSGTKTNEGAKNFTFQGSNEATAFAELTYGTDTNWTNLTTAVSLFTEHVAADQVDPKYILVTNSTAYRYYAIKIADGLGSTSFVGLRRIVLQTQD